MLESPKNKLMKFSKNKINKSLCTEGLIDTELVKRMGEKCECIAYKGNVKRIFNGAYIVCTLK